MARLIRLNFYLAVFLSAVFGLMLWVIKQPDFWAQLTAVFPTGSRIMGPSIFTILGPVQIGLWWLLYRHAEGHRAALVIGVFILIAAFSGLFNSAVDWSQPITWLPYGFVYISISHILYAGQNWQSWLNSRGHHG